MWFIVSAGGGGAEVVVKSTTGVVSGVSAVWEGAGGSGMTAFATGGAILLHGGGPELPAGSMCPGGGGVMGVPLGSSGGLWLPNPPRPLSLVHLVVRLPCPPRLLAP